MPIARALIFSRRWCLMTIARTSDPGPFSIRFRKRKTVPMALTDQPRDGASKRARSPVRGLLISSSAPTRVGSSAPPGSGATTPSRATRTRRSVDSLFRSTSLLPARRWSSACAAPKRPSSKKKARKYRGTRSCTCLGLLCRTPGGEHPSASTPSMRAPRAYVDFRVSDARAVTHRRTGGSVVDHLATAAGEQAADASGRGRTGAATEEGAAAREAGRRGRGGRRAEPGARRTMRCARFAGNARRGIAPRRLLHRGGALRTDAWREAS
jgi:hypothetical protein